MQPKIITDNAKPLRRRVMDHYCKIFNVDREKAAALTAAAITDYRIAPYQKVLEQRWYESIIMGGSPDYSVYDDEFYFTDLLACWHLYSRNYLLSISKPNGLDFGLTIRDYVGDLNCVIDIGCGVGITTRALASIFGAKTYGVNLKNTKQFRFCESSDDELAEYGTFTTVGDVSEIPEQDGFVFASEYFEHIHEPIAHLVYIIDRINPKYFFIANAFNTVSVGHFTDYRIGENIVDQKIMSRLFNEAMRNLGYVSVKTKLWNNKPALWERI